MKQAASKDLLTECPTQSLLQRVHPEPDCRVGPRSPHFQHLASGHCLRAAPWDEGTMVMLHGPLRIQRRRVSPFEGTAAALSLWATCSEAAHGGEGRTFSAGPLTTCPSSALMGGLTPAYQMPATSLSCASKSRLTLNMATEPSEF